MKKVSLIIAAGKGSRIEEIGSPKPLIKINDKALIDYVILSMKKAGIREIFVVVGYKSDEIKSYLENVYNKSEISIKFIQNDMWEKGNGVSVFCAEKYIDSPFILSMSDHLFSYKIIEKLLANDFSKYELFLATDLNLKNELIDLGDVTKVLFDTQNNSIMSIGKSIKKYNGYDTGVFYCNTTLFKAIQTSIASGADSLSAAVQELAKNRLASIVDIGEEFWLDVDDVKSFRLAKKFIMKIK